MVKYDKIQSLKRRDQITVALAMKPDLWIRKEAQERGWRLLNLQYCEYILPQGIIPQGALVDMLPDDDRVQELLKLGCHVVRLGTLFHPDDAKMPAVLPDQELEGALAADYYSDRGFKNIAYYGRNPWGDFFTFYDAFRKRGEELGMVCHLYRLDSLREHRGDRMRRRQQEFVRWLKGVPKPVGLLAHGDVQAAVQCSWIIQAGMDIPGEVAVLSRSNGRSDVFETSIPSISYIDPAAKQRAHEACELLSRLMEGRQAPKKPIMIFSNRVIGLESTDVRATEDRIVAKALNYISHHLDKDISVEQIASEVGLSSSQLRRRFKKSLNSSVIQEMRRMRLDEVKDLLESTEMPIKDIARSTGFHSTAYLHRTFRKTFDMTPAKYRREKSQERG